MVCDDLTIVMKEEHVLIRMQPYDIVVLQMRWVSIADVVFLQEVVLVRVPRAL
jgi:hypothetical protein